MDNKIYQLTLQNRRPDVYKLLTELGCEFKGIDYVSIDDLVLDQGIYPRDKTDWERVKLYAEDMENGDIFPPLLVEEEYKVILDGNHRYYASKEIDKAVVWIEKWEVPENLYPVVAQAVNTEKEITDTPLSIGEKKRAILRDWSLLAHLQKDERIEKIIIILKTSEKYVKKVLSEAGIIKNEKELKQQEVLNFHKQGLSPKEISEKTGVNLKTVYRWLDKFSKITEVKNENLDTPTQQEEPTPDYTEEPDWSDWNEEEPKIVEVKEKPKKEKKEQDPDELFKALDEHITYNICIMLDRFEEEETLEYLEKLKEDIATGQFKRWSGYAYAFAEGKLKRL